MFIYTELFLFVVWSGLLVRICIYKEEGYAKMRLWPSVSVSFGSVPVSVSVL